MRLYTSESGSHIVLQPGGNVGIGTTKPKNILHVTGNAGVLNLEGKDHAYIQWYPDGFGSGRKAWTGFGDKDSNDFAIANAIDGGDILLRPRNGNVGIGTTNPRAKLHVNGVVRASGYTTGGIDVAEYFPTPEDPEPGTVMVIDPAGGSKLMSSMNAYDTTVAGIVSTAPGVSLGTKEDGNDGERLIAVAGRVPCKVDASYAQIMPGDLLTTSDTPGHAMKAQPVEIGGIEIYRPGTTIGKALEPLDAGTGTIEVLVTLQ